MSITFYGPSSQDDGDVLGTVAMCVRDQVNAGTFTAAQHTDWTWALREYKKHVEFHLIQGGVLTLQRNEAIQRMKGEWLLFIDDDMVWDNNAVQLLVQSWYDLGDPTAIMGALCFRRSPPYEPTLFMRERRDGGAYNFLEDWPDGIVEVDATGCAFLLIPVAALEKIAGSPQPPYPVRRQMAETRQKPPNFFRWEGGIGEDLRFCQDAKAAGCPIYVDTRIEIGHITEVMVDHRSYWAKVAERPLELERVRRRVNRTMGLPTLSRRQARKKLGWD